jgi:hypothetical protein
VSWDYLLTCLNTFKWPGVCETVKMYGTCHEGVWVAWVEVEIHTFLRPVPNARDWSASSPRFSTP